MADRKRYPYGMQYKTAVEMMANKRSLKSGPMGAVRALLTFLNKETGQAYPSKATLADRMGGGERSAQRHCATLEAMGIIEAVAYRTGGHGRSTVWKFTAPAWATPEHYQKEKNPAKLAEYDGKNPAKLSTYPAKLSTYPAKLAPQPDKNLIRTGINADADAPVVGRGAATPFRKWDGKEPYGQYLSEKQRSEKEALRAAENERGEKISADALCQAAE